MGKLVAARLLVTGQDPATEEPTVEVAHEALIQAWPRLRQWVADYRPFIRWYESELSLFLHRWLNKGKSPDLLLSQSMLPLAQEWLARFPELLEGPAAAYIQACVEKAEAEQRARERLRRRITMGLAAGLVITLVLTFFAWWQRNEAVRQRIAAEAAQATAVAEANIRATAQAQTEEQRNLALAAQTTAEARRQEDEEQRDLALGRQLAVQALYMSRAPRSTTEELIASLPAMESLRYGHSIEAYDVLQKTLFNWLPLRARIWHEGTVRDVTFSPDGRYLATASNDSTAALVEVAAGREIARIRHEDSVRDVTFSPNGRYLATASWDDTAALVELATGRELARIRHEGSVEYVTFSPDGRFLVTAGGSDVFIFPLDQDELFAQVCARLLRNLRLSEWRRFFGSEPYRQTCPNLPVPEE